ncbi:Xanthine dehydrogenase/oxidase [Geodia barretti]|uniref:Xanthine dehydrogenase/oxidase n=1 Tax=Geodia barretti TaxID=519541 RepID=A0AA35RZE9_GEOBA|nr:Xanthine dehydrogenase/oxidase [Geodia barretti]
MIFFPSDVFVVMAAVGATLSIATSSSTQSVSLWDFLTLDMSKSVIVSMEIPFASADTVFRSYKIMPRSENAHAYVNAAFVMQFNSSTSTVTGEPTLVFGGIQAHDIQATQTAAMLEGANLLQKDTLTTALAKLEGEIVPVTTPVSSSAKYLKSLAISLFYKYYLAVIYDHVDPRVQSAAVPFQRPLSTGTQTYGTKPSEYPVTEPMTKLTALLQTSGEAEYTTDVPPLPHECAAAFVLSPQANCKITGVDFSTAEGMPGFIKGLTAADIPGDNNFMTMGTAEPVLVSDVCEYAGQAVAIVVAETQRQADEIALAVKVSYESQGKPLLTIADAIAAGSYFEDPGRQPIEVGDAKAAIAKSARTVEGTISCDSQYHFHMETQTSLVIPEAEGYMVYSSTQWTQRTQAAVAAVLGINNSSVDVSVRRVGGAYGGKITRSHWIAAACGLAAHATGRPVRMHLDIDTNMKMIGKRIPYYATFTIGCTEDGILNGIEATVYNNCGWCNNDNALGMALDHIDNAYYVPNWLVTPKACKTNIAANTATRSPGTCPGIFIMEGMIDQVARTLGLDPDTVRRANLYKKDQVTPIDIPLTYCNISTLWDDLYSSAEVESRKAAAAKFNEENRWRKRGLSVVPVRFWMEWGWAVPYTVHINIYAADGTVAICHGGVEVGQGINTKVAQVAAKTLGIPLDTISVKPSNTLIGPNDITTGGSITSELCCLGTLRACNELNERISPVRAANPKATWKELVAACNDQGVNLSVENFVEEKTDYQYSYNAYGVGCTEVEIDVLTGELQILRVDILYDCGDSINPDIDVGQVEGAFTMGLGYWLTEKLIFDQDSGQLLTHNTWVYH